MVHDTCLHINSRHPTNCIKSSKSSWHIVLYRILSRSQVILLRIAFSVDHLLIFELLKMLQLDGQLSIVHTAGSFLTLLSVTFNVIRFKKLFCTGKQLFFFQSIKQLLNKPNYVLCINAKKSCIVNEVHVYNEFLCLWFLRIAFIRTIERFHNKYYFPQIFTSSTGT